MSKLNKEVLGIAVVAIALIATICITTVVLSAPAHAFDTNEQVTRCRDEYGTWVCRTTPY